MNKWDKHHDMNTDSILEGLIYSRIVEIRASIRFSVDNSLMWRMIISIIDSSK